MGSSFLHLEVSRPETPGSGLHMPGCGREVVLWTVKAAIAAH